VTPSSSNQDGYGDVRIDTDCIPDKLRCGFLINNFKKSLSIFRIFFSTKFKNDFLKMEEAAKEQMSKDKAVGTATIEEEIGDETK